MTLLSSIQKEIRPQEHSKVASGVQPVIARLSIGQAFERPLGRSSRGRCPRGSQVTGVMIKDQDKSFLSSFSLIGAIAQALWCIFVFSSGGI
jgi:hypothetical protein